MNFVVFPVGATNIFPLANSSAGGQLLSEFNIRSRESVETNPNVKFFIGPSFTHSLDDFYVYCQKDGQGIDISNTAIQIQPGRALINGHYVESLTPVVLDMNDVNHMAQKEGMAPLKGKLAVGLRMAYSTYQTLAGSALTEDENGDYYRGVQVVIVPENAVKLPGDQGATAETEFTNVNMHLLLATFTYRNGVISGVKQNESKIQSIPASRISDMDNIFSDTFVTKTGLDPNKLYVFAGKSADGQHVDGRDTWCDATDSLIKWDSNPRIDTTLPSSQAEFRYDSDSGLTSLVLPHKQVDGMVNTSGQSVYFQDKSLSLPLATFAGNGGVIGPEYTRRVREIESKINSYYSLPNGKMRQFIPLLTDRNDLPLIPASDDTKWPYSESEYTSAVDGFRAEIKSLAIKFDKLRRDIITIINEQVVNILPDQLNNSAIIENIQSSIRNIQDNLQELSSRIGTQEGTAPSGSPSTAEFNDLKSRVTTINTNLTTLQNTVNTLQSHLPADIEAEVQAELESIQAEIEEAYQISLNNMKSDLKQYIDAWMQRELDDRSALSKWTWRPGDYVLVGEDRTVEGNLSGRYPTTMYVIRPGRVGTITQLTGIGPGGVSYLETVLDTSSPNYNTDYNEMLHRVPTTLTGGVPIDEKLIDSADQAVDGLWDLTLSEYRGAPGIDYFVARLRTESIEEIEGVSVKLETWRCYYWTPTSLISTYDYSDPLWITGGVPLATESSVGGFINVPSDAYGGGYVWMDENGYLRVLDYEMLLTGVLSFQLGQDRNEGAGLSIDEIQSILDENVNERICFPNAQQIVSATESQVDPHIIHLYLTLPEDPGSLRIHDIGSRYESCLYLHIRGSATSATTLSIENCDKLRIDEDIEGAPTILLNSVNLYYDATVLDACSYIDNLSLWYHRWSDMDPELQVDGMTVALTGPIDTTDNIDPWDSTYANDNHYSYSLRSITFGNDGSIINIGMLVGDSTTANIIDEGKSVFVAPFVLPQSAGLNYPVSKMTHKIKVTGSFVSCYPLQHESGFMMKQTEFSALTQQYDPVSGQVSTDGTIAFYTDAQIVTHINGVEPGGNIDAWDLNTPHYFIGGDIT